MYNGKNMRDETRIDVLKCFDTWSLQHVIQHFKSAFKSYILWREISYKFGLLRQDIDNMKVHAKHRILSALKIHSGNIKD